MSTFKIDNSKNSNLINTTPLYKNIVQSASNSLLDIPNSTFFNDDTRNKIEINKKIFIAYSPNNNERRNVRMPLDAQAIRQDEYNYSKDRFNPNFPESSNYPLCPQKISTVFQYGSKYWSTSNPNAAPHNPLPVTYVDLSKISQLATNDCSCFFVDFTGEYLLEWSTNTNGGTLLDSNNSNVTLGSFVYHETDQYFEIFLNPTQQTINNSYLHIQYRIPIRHRTFHNDWIYWENATIDNSQSDTEFVRAVNCCQTAENTLLVRNLIAKV